MMGILHPTTDGDCFVAFSTNMDIVQFETSKTVLGHDCLTKRGWKLGRIIRDDKHSDLGRASADYSLRGVVVFMVAFVCAELCRAAGLR